MTNILGTSRSTCPEGFARHACDVLVYRGRFQGDSQLSMNARSLIQDQSNNIEISPASYWEIAIKVSIGKWKLNRPYEDFLDIGLNQYGFQVLPIHHNHTARLIGLPFHHNDPFDRLRVAQSSVEDIPVVSKDANLDAYGITRHW